MRHAIPVMIVAGLATQTACYDDAPDQTVDIATEDLSVNVTARAVDQATEVDLWFSTPEPTAELRFSAGDILSLRGEGFDVFPSRNAQGLFLATLPADITTWAIVLDRTEDTSGAVDIPMFPPAGLTAPQLVSRDTVTEITWTPSRISGAHTVLAMRGTCFQTIERVVPDDVGSYLIQPADFATSSETCPADITLDRSLVTGVPSPLLANVRLTLYRTDRITVESTP